MDAADPHPPRRGQRGLPRDARAAARAAVRRRGRRVGRRRVAGRARVPRAPARRRADGLPAAGPRRRPGDRGDPRGVSRDGGRVPHCLDRGERGARAARGRRGALPVEEPGARHDRGRDPRGRRHAEAASDGADGAEHGDRARLDRRLPRGAASASRTSASSRSTSASAPRATATTSSSGRRSSTAACAPPPSCRRRRSRRRRTSSTSTRSSPATSGSSRCRSRASSPARTRARSSPRSRSGGDRVRVHDSRTASAAIAILALAVQRRLERGTTDEEVEELVASYADRAGLLFTVDTLEFLARGGRIGKARAMAGQLLHIKPILAIRDGEVEPIKRVRGNQKAFMEFVSQFRDHSADGPDLQVGIAHADAPGARAGARRDGAARAAAGAGRDRDHPRRRRRHPRWPGHGRVLLVRGRGGAHGSPTSPLLRLRAFESRLGGLSGG